MHTNHFCSNFAELGSVCERRERERGERERERKRERRERERERERERKDREHAHVHARERARVRARAGVRARRQNTPTILAAIWLSSLLTATASLASSSPISSIDSCASTRT